MWEGKKMITDSHAHLGYDVVFDEEQSEEDLIRYNTLYDITASVVQPFVTRPYMEDTEEIHNRIYELCVKYPGKFYGMASINPHFRPYDYEKEAFRCVKTLGFKALKLTPIAHASNPSSVDGRHVFEIAESLKVPVMVHTGSGAPFSDPARLLSVLPDYKGIPVILAHAGTDLLFTQALYLAEQFDNVFLEPSWLSILCVRKALRTIGAGKIMFSSDHAVNIPVELAKYRALLEGTPELDQVLWKTAKQVFGI